MDDLEFRKRAFANPSDDDPEFTDAAKTHPDRQRLLDELISLENDLAETLNAVSVPDNLAHRLKQQGGSGMQPPSRFRPYLTLAASLVIATALTLAMLGQNSQPNAREAALHDQVVAHLRDEASEYAGDEQISIEEVAQVVSSRGGELADQSRLADIHLKFAKECIVGESHQGTHVVIQGENGPVSLMYVDSSPVSEEMELDDGRFSGIITPHREGNLAIVGEKGESLETFRSLAENGFNWSI